MTIREHNGRPTCAYCGRQWSAMVGDNELPERCECLETRDPEDYGRDFWRQPQPEEGETLIFSEPGRIHRRASGNGTDYRSHSIAVVRGSMNDHYLLMRHGGGDERWLLARGYQTDAIDGLARMTSDERYLMLYNFARIARDQHTAGRQAAATEYAQAFAEGRLKKLRRKGRVYVEIQPRVIAPAA